MKVSSVWQPYASLLAYGYKTIETKIWPAPVSLIGERMAFASTKTIKPEQRGYFADEDFQSFYSRLGLPATLEELPCGYLLCTAILDSCEVVTEELLETISAEEQTYGWFEVPGRVVYAWRMRDVQRLEHPIPYRGLQGLTEYHGFDTDRTSPARAVSGV